LPGAKNFIRPSDFGKVHELTGALARDSLLRACAPPGFVGLWPG